MKPDSPQLVLPIQYLRGVAALMVVWHHGIGQIQGVEGYFPLRFGTSGVDLFFVISGFIMVMTTAGKNVTPMNFIGRRFIRVVPLYWMLTLALVALLLVAPSLFRTTVLTPGSLIQSLLFIPHYSPSHAGEIWPILVPGWTLNFEMFFYLVFAASLAFRQPLIVLASALGMLVAAGYLLGPFSNPIAKTYSDPILLEFVAGALIGHRWTAGRLRLPLPISIMAMVLGFALLVLRDSPPLGSFTQLLGAVFVVYGSLNVYLLRWHNGLLLALGDASYSIYLTHIISLGAWRWIWAKTHPMAPDFPTAALFMLTAMSFCAFVGWISFRWIETPLLSRSKALLGTRVGTKASVASKTV